MEGVQEKSSLLMLVASSEAENEQLLSVQETEIQEKNTVMELSFRHSMTAILALLSKLFGGDSG